MVRVLRWWVATRLVGLVSAPIVETNVLREAVPHALVLLVTTRLSLVRALIRRMVPSAEAALDESRGVLAAAAPP